MVENIIDTDIVATMEYLNGSFSRKDRVDDPVPATVNVKSTHLIRLMVPVIHPDTDEVIADVGCYLDMGIIQKGVELLMSYNYDFVMTIFSNDGLIMGSYYPYRVGKMMDAEDMLSSHKQEAEMAIFEGIYSNFTTYSAALKDNLNVFMIPISIGNSDVKWTILTAVPESILRRYSLFYNVFGRR